eukprot:CCRYP_018636-RA/>CCRYP_018636-RA protein AED:0.16 eAED:0.16 QI:0/-1/0/1/-1/1/1/0/244
MSLLATSTLSRHLLPQLFRRHFSDGVVKGSGLRRIRTSGRVNNASTPLSPQSSPPPSSPASSSPEAASNPLNVDPHAIANEMISSSSASRPSGSEAVASYLTREQKISNYAMAAGLFAFVSYVFYYSLASVGGGDNARKVILGMGAKEGEGAEGNELGTNAGFREFLKEAKEGMAEEEIRLEKERKAKGEANKLVDLDNAAAMSTLSEDEEREMERAAGFEDGEKGGVNRRPLWRRVVFFWRRD